MMMRKLAPLAMKIKPRLGGRPGEPKRLEWFLDRCGVPEGMAPALAVRLAAMVMIAVALVSLGTFDSFKVTPDQPAVVSEPVYPPPAEEKPVVVPAKTGTSPKVVKTSSKPVSVRPVAGKVIREYGLTYSQTFKDYRYHAGIDYAAAKGTPVRAAGAGKVLAASENKDEGLVILIDHGNGWESRYAGLTEAKVKKGRTVKAGDNIALVGPPGRLEAAEGNHLHFELVQNGQQANPVKHLP